MSTVTADQFANFLRSLKIALIQLRTCRSLQANNLYWGKCRGFALAALMLGVLTDDQFSRLESMIDSASEHGMRESPHV